MANLALEAADRGQVHLVQLRNGPFDFSYLAIKASYGPAYARCICGASRSAAGCPAMPEVLAA